MTITKPIASRKRLEKLLEYLGNTGNYSNHYKGNRAEDFKKCFDTESPWCWRYADIALRGMKERELDYKEAHHIVPRCFYGCGRYVRRGLAGNSTSISFLEHVYAHYCMLRCAKPGIASRLAGAFLFLAGLKTKGKRPVIPDEKGLDELLETLDMSYARSQREDYAAIEAEGGTHKCDDPKQYYREWKKKNPDKVLANQRRYQANNIEKVRERNRAYSSSKQGKAKDKEYRETHKESIAAYSKAYRTEHAEELKLKKKIYQEQNADKIREKKKAWYAANKEEISQKRRLSRDDAFRAKESEKHKKYYAEHREEIRKRQNEYRKAHREEYKARDRMYYETHKAERAIKDKIYRDAHKEESAAYRAANRDRFLAKDKARYDAKINAGYRLRKNPETGKREWVFVGIPEKTRSK